MRWAYALKSKMKVATLLAVVLGLVMMNNLLERRQMNTLRTTFKEIYHDRLMAEIYIFQLYDHLNRKLDLFQSSDHSNRDIHWTNNLDTHNEAIARLANDYGQTYLTDQEKNHFSDLRQSLESLNHREEALTKTNFGPYTGDQITEIHQLTDACFTSLSALSEIQVMEGQVLKAKSNRTIMGSISSSHFEMSVLILIALIIQVLVFSGKPLTFHQKPGLN